MEAKENLIAYHWEKNFSRSFSAVVEQPRLQTTVPAPFSSEEKRDGQLRDGKQSSNCECTYCEQNIDLISHNISMKWTADAHSKHKTVQLHKTSWKKKRTKRTRVVKKKIIISIEFVFVKMSNYNLKKTLTAVNEVFLCYLLIS